jgi:hypothetical protein
VPFNEAYSESAILEIIAASIIVIVFSAVGAMELGVTIAAVLVVVLIYKQFKKRAEESRQRAAPVKGFNPRSYNDNFHWGPMDETDKKPAPPQRRKSRISP